MATSVHYRKLADYIQWKSNLEADYLNSAARLESAGRGTEASEMLDYAFRMTLLITVAEEKQRGLTYQEEVDAIKRGW